MTPGIGHNQEPPLGGSWSGYCWRRARREIWDNPPVEVIRRRKRRAEEIGLTYRQYAGILLDKGVRTEALVFDLSGLPAPVPAAPMARMTTKLRALRNCQVFAAIGETRKPLDEINAHAGGVITDWAPYPPELPRVPALNDVLQPVLDMLRRHTVAPSAAIMIGNGWRAGRIAETARLARVFPAAAYFG